MQGFSTKKTYAMLERLRNVTLYDIGLCNRISQLCSSRQEQIDGEPAWEFANKLIVKRANFGMQLCQKTTRFSMKRPIPPQYMFFLKVKKVCKSCANGGQEECPFLAHDNMADEQEVGAFGALQ